MLRFWRNPEFIRHVRAELRPVRALSVALVVLVIMALVGLGCWTSERQNTQEVFQYFCAWLIILQYGVLTIWCIGTCGQAISRERELKTYDFLKTTRLTSSELMIGKLLGEPVMGYFLVGCSLPVSFLSGILGGFSLRVLLWTYVLLIFLALFVSVVSLWGSMLVEKPSAGALGMLVLVPILGFSGFGDTPFPGFAALSVFPALFKLFNIREFQVTRIRPTLFGAPVHFLFVTLLLYVLFGAWFALMLARNLKKEREQIHLLSRWQAIGFAAFLNTLFYLFLDPRLVGPKLGIGAMSPDDVSLLAVGLNSLILFLVGLAMLTPREKLKVWWRRREERAESFFSEHGLPWPWLVPAAVIAYAMLWAEAAGLRQAVPIQEWRLGTSAVQLFVFLVFTARDILFLQWCLLTQMKRPVLKGFLYLLLYYFAVGMVGWVAATVRAGLEGYVFSLCPFYALSSKGVRPHDLPGLYWGLALQIPVILVLLSAIRNRLGRAPTFPVASNT